MQFIQFTAARADTGAVLPFAPVTVYAAGTSTLAALFDVNGASIGNPFQANINGLAGLAAADGLYDIQVQSADGSYTAPKMLSVQIVDLVALRGTVTSGRLGYATWAELAVVTGTAGQLAEVPITDAGTHTDPVVGGTVNNTGIFRYSTSPAGWRRIYDTDAASAKTYSDAAQAAEATLAPLLDVIENADALPPAALVDVQGRPFFTWDSDGNPLDRNAKQLGTSSVFSSVATALAATPGTPQALFAADMVNALAPQTYVRRCVFAWDEAYSISPTSSRCDSARFGTARDYDGTHSFNFFSPRSVSLNDGENRMKLAGKLATRGSDLIPTYGSLVDVDVPSAFTSGSDDGASWNCADWVVGDYHHFWFQRLNGAYSGGGRYDLYGAYRRISTGALSTPRLLLGGAAAYPAYGVADGGGVGLNMAGVDPIALLGNGYLVLVAFLDTSPKKYLASLRVSLASLTANPDTYTLTPGTALQYASTGHNEVTITERMDGGGICTVRDDNTNARGIYTTVDGLTFSYLREDTVLSLSNEANGLLYMPSGVPVTLVSGSVDPTQGNRQQAAIFLCYGNDITPMAIVRDIWDPAERIEYMSIRAAPNGNVRIFFEDCSIGTDISFNQRVGLSEIEVSRSRLMASAVAL